MGLNFYIMDNMTFFIPIEDFDAFKEKATDMDIEILSDTPYPEEKIVKLNVLVTDFTAIYVLGSMVGYARAYREAQPAMDNALKCITILKDKLNNLINLDNQLSELK